MSRGIQFTGVFIALVLSAAGYRITRGLTSGSNAVYEFCVKEYERELPAIMKVRRLPPATASEFCHSYLRAPTVTP
jgi:hypothetical protein